MPMNLSEDELVAAISRLLSGDDPAVVVGLGDDAAVLEPAVGQQVLTTDLLVEGVHFDRTTISAHDLGGKAITVNVSDIAAMGGSPRAAVVAVALAPDVETPWVMELIGGMRDACAGYAVRLVGGDTNRGDLVILSVTVVGEVAPGRAVTRSGARPGDAVVVTGDLGAAAGGLALSRVHPSKAASALSEWGRPLADALARPAARVGEGRILARSGATAMMDLSDGLAIDLSRMCRASGVAARIVLADVPIAPPLREGASELGVDAMDLAIAGGEDYELLATIHPDDVDPARVEIDDRFGVTLTRIGTIIEGAGVLAVAADGTEAVLEPRGWDHFA